MKSFKLSQTFCYLLILSLSILFYIPFVYATENQAKAMTPKENGKQYINSHSSDDVLQKQDVLAENKEKMNLALKEFNKTFKLFDKNISPKVFSEFNIWISDSGIRPVQIATDIAAIDENPNRFFGDFETVKYDDSDKDWIVLKNAEGGFIEYAWYGRLKNGLHIILVRDNGGGSLTTLTLYALRSRLSQGLFESPNNQIVPYNRLLLEQILQKNVSRYGNLVLKDNTVKSIQDNKVLWEITFPEHINEID